MDTKSIFLPALAMVALTFVVWVRMYVVRIGQMRRERIHPQSIAMSAQVAQRLSDTRASDNFRNLFELPVLFYAALAAAAATGQGTGAVLALAWLFVALRVVHSAIQCGYNKVMHRFWAYIAGALVLWTLWGAIAFGWWSR
ncbi:MAPEG family protein [Lysobacter sp. LF1]|uniref:MAPEG family protein n=1 Tax=Lysobacter stagni TaxID=3045172 RepID=A0ABT6XJ46_9GAMM|nr:MAPEG family protein [Lysobacter sp. LF1]MDI9240186.1 MAPEG family protein [Lysobacter sp. LF1]